ncbi:hypothetical protein IMG5_107380, partial [Ichthyophthirius multifiliis]
YFIIFFFNMIKSFAQLQLFSIRTQLQFQSQFYKTTYIRQPKLKCRTVQQIYPPPGLNLEIPKDWSSEEFLKRIGNGTSEFADKFKDIDQIFKFSSRQMKSKGVPCKARKHIQRIREQLRRGLITFEYLGRRTCLEIQEKNQKKK